jgi:hypothetical protein
MSLHGLPAWIRAKRRGLTHPQADQGIMISKRLKELLDVTNSKPVETASTQPQSEDDQNKTNRDKFGT